jgi:hypothetical protein
MEHSSRCKTKTANAIGVVIAGPARRHYTSTKRSPKQLDRFLKAHNKKNLLPRKIAPLEENSQEQALYLIG